MVSVLITGWWVLQQWPQDPPLVKQASLAPPPEAPQAAATHPDSTDDQPAVRLPGKIDLQPLLASTWKMPADGHPLTIDYQTKQFRVETTLDPVLQAYLLAKIDRRHLDSIGIVAVEPPSGRILAMVGEDSQNSGSNPCTEIHYPAASVFKIVSAAAAVEKCGFEPDSQVSFRGARHTLYRSQLKKGPSRLETVTTFRKAFAQSVNPFFGRIGIQLIGKQALASYAEAFGFNYAWPLEIDCVASRFTISEVPYQWAELASGFNRQTSLTPLHGALLAAVVANGGQLMEPMLVDRITDVNNQAQAIYRGRPQSIGRAVTPATAIQLAELMETTIQSGTARKTFRGYKRHKALAGLEIGGKTGTIDTATRSARIDWFVGYAAQRPQGAQIALAVVVGHKDFIGTRAAQYGRWLIEKYYQDSGSHLAASSQAANAATRTTN
jgi:cell division protein FtsI/penicillin-binding protein 2